MKKIITFFVLLLSFSSAFAVGRVIPSDSFFVQITDVDLQKRTIKLVDANDGFFKKLYKSAYVFEIPNTIKIRNEKNMWVVRNKLLNYKKHIVAVRFTNRDKINEIYVLTDEEIKNNIEKIKQQNWKGETKK